MNHAGHPNGGIQTCLLKTLVWLVSGFKVDSDIFWNAFSVVRFSS